MTDDLLFIPGPVRLAQPVLAAMTRPMIDHRGPAFAALRSRIVERLKPIFGTHADVLLLGGSGTSGLEAAVVSTFSPGDALLACPVGVFGRRLAAIAQNYGCAVETLETPLGHALDAAALERRLRADTQRAIKGILLTHNETSTGVQNDMAALAPILREHGALTIVDSVSGLGASEFRMDEWGYDVVIAATQKALAAPPGMAMVALGERARNAIETSAGPRFYLDLERAREFASLGQTPWTPPVSIAFALDAALELYAAEGARSAWERHARFARTIRSAVREMGLELFSQPDAHSVTVVAMRVPESLDAVAILRALREQHGVVLSGGQLELKGKILRMGTMGAIAPADVHAALEALAAALAQAGVRRGDARKSAGQTAVQTTGAF